MIDVLWPWADTAPPAAPDGAAILVLTNAAPSLAAGFRAAARLGTGSPVVLPAGPTADALDAAMLLAATRGTADLATFASRGVWQPEPICITRDAWDALSIALGEHEPHRHLAFVAEAWRIGRSVAVVSGPTLHAQPGFVDAAAVLSSLLRTLGAFPDPHRRVLLGLGIAEVLGLATRTTPSLPERFRFGASGQMFGYDDLGGPTLCPLLVADELARELPRAASAGPTAGDLGGASLAALVPPVGLTPEARGALEEILGLRGAPRLPVPEPRPLRPESGWHGVSVIVPTLDAADLLSDCLASIRDAEPERIARDGLEVIVVDNGSRDATADVVARFPFARRVALATNEGFAGPCNRGAREARGDVLVFLNNDTLVDRAWLPELLAAVQAGHAAASSLVLSQSGREVDFGGGGINFEGKGFQDGHGDPDVAAWTGPAPLLFANGASFAIRRDVWERHGGFDASFFAYYEDVDLGVRLALAGDSVSRAGRSQVRHRHNATSRRFPASQKTFHMERNALLVTLKTWTADTLARVLPAALLLLARRACLRARLDGAEILRGGRVDAGALSELRSGDAGQRVGWEDLACHVAAAGETLAWLPRIAAARRQAQALRRVADTELVGRAGHFLDPAPTPDREGYAATQARLLDALGVAELVSRAVRRRILIVTHEDISGNLAGPAIRVLEMARVLAASHDVAIAAPKIDGTLPPPPGVRLATYDRWEEPTLLAIARGHDVLVVQGHTLQRYGRLARTGAAIVADLYCPFPLENLELMRGRTAADAAVGTFEGDLEALDLKLVAGDYFLVASEKQKDLWMGALLHAGRVNPFTYGDDPRLDRLVGVVPFGIPSEPPERKGPGAKGAIPGIGAGDRLLLWGGSLVDWQDPLTVVRAMARVAASHPEARLLFMGVAHPTPGVKPMEAVARCRDLARSLGLLDTHVFFHPWVPYAERTGVLLDADVGVLAHKVHVETRYSFRTRMLDAIWASLPTVITEGDTFSELVGREGLGVVVPPEDPDAFARALLRLLDDPDLVASCRRNLERLRPDHTWERALAPLVARLPALQPSPDRTWLKQRGWRRALMRYGAGNMLDTARRRLPAPVRRTIKRLLRMGS